MDNQPKPLIFGAVDHNAPLKDISNLSDRKKVPFFKIA